MEEVVIDRLVRRIKKVVRLVGYKKGLGNLRGSRFCEWEGKRVSRKYAEYKYHFVYYLSEKDR